MNLFAGRITKLGNESAFMVSDDIQKCEAEGKQIIKLNLGEPDFDSAPNINRIAIENIEIGNSHYSDPQGLPALRQSIARSIFETRQVNINPEQIVITSGGKPSIGYSMITYVNPGDEVIYPSPGFPIYESWINFLGAVPVPIHLKEEKSFRFDASDLEPLITPRTKLLIINSPSNPAGSVLTREDLIGIAFLIKNNANPNVRVLSDEVYDKIIFDGKEHESIISLPDMAQRTILLNSFSKSFAMTGWRLGYAVLPTVEEADIFCRLNINIYSCVPPFIQMAGKEALDNEENKEIAVRRCREFELRRDMAVDALNSIDGIQCVKPAGAFYTYPNINTICNRLGILEIHEKMKKGKKDADPPSRIFQKFLLYYYGVATLDGASFGARTEEDNHYLRISTASSLEILKEGINRLEAASKDVTGFQKFIQEME